MAALHHSDNGRAGFAGFAGVCREPSD